MKTRKKLYHLESNAGMGYDTYDSAVVCSTSKENAIIYAKDTYSWSKEPSCTFLGYAEDSVDLGEVIASFNAA